MKPRNIIPSDLSRFEFNSQAAGYDARTQLGEAAARTIAAAVASLARSELKALARPLTILEVGAGTGEIGTWLSREGRYTGFDASKEMLDAFDARLKQGGEGGAKLHVADANDRWPVQEANTDLVFLSRVLHLLDRRHVEAELHRIKGGAGVIVLSGRARRDSSSIGSQLRRLMLSALEDRGYTPRRGERRSADFFEELCGRGAIRVASREVATVRVERSARQRLEAWRNKGGLGGLDLPADERERVLSEVEGWARQTWADLDQAETTDEAYCVEGVLLDS